MNSLTKKNRKIFKIALYCIGLMWIASCEPIFEEPQRGIEGTWYCREVHDNDGTRNYYIDIEYKDGDSSTVYMINFLDLDRQSIEKSLFIYARVFGNSISIPQQTIEDHTIEGSGSISSSTITLEFTDDLYGGIPWNATATLTRR